MAKQLLNNTTIAKKIFDTLTIFDHKKIFDTFIEQWQDEG